MSTIITEHTYKIAHRITMMRRAVGASQRDIARMLCVTPAAYGKIEYVRCKLATDYCAKLAEYYGVSNDYILCGTAVSEREKLFDQYIALTDEIRRRCISP